MNCFTSSGSQNCAYMHEVFHFLSSYQPFKSHHLVGSHKLQGMMKVTATSHDSTSIRLCTKACMEPKHTTSFKGVGSHTYIHSHIRILYICTGDIYHLIVMYICDTTGTYTNSIHIIYMGCNRTSAYNINNTVCTVNT